MPSFRDEAVCLRTWDWSETSQTACLLTTEHGILRGLAKGSKRERSAFGGGFEPLTRGELLAIPKPAGKLTTLTSWELTESFRSVRTALAAFHAAMYLAEVTMHVLSEGDPHPEVYRALVEALRMLDDPARAKLAVAWFLWRTLVDTGYRADLESVAGTRQPLPDQPTYLFDPSAGGFLPDGRPGDAQRPPWRVRAETLGFLRRMNDAADAAALASITSDEAERPARLLATWVRELVGAPLHTHALLFGT